MKALIVIPAKGTSKSIPKKNMRRLGNKPLVSYPIDKALKLVNEIDLVDFDIVVSSDDRYIEEYVRMIKNIDFIPRPDKLSKDDTPLDPVVYHSFMNAKNTYDYDFVITLVPTMPLLSVDTMIKAVNSFFEEKAESLILVKDATHIYWQNNKPLTERKNRQFLDPIYEECGGIIITNAKHLKTKKKILTKKPYLFICPPDEDVDINTWHDFILAEKLLNRKKIGFKVGGNHKAGLGHVYRCINLALRFIEHEIYFFIDERDKEAIDAIESFYFKVVEYYDIIDLIKKVTSTEINAVINDTLGIDTDFAELLQQRNIPIIGLDEYNKEYCALTINPQLEFTETSYNDFYGYKYSIIREDVMMFPIKNYPNKTKKILITMGGSDPEHVTVKIMKYLKEHKNITVIIGKYFSKKDKKEIENLAIMHSFSIVEDVKFMGTFLFDADIVITSNSSTVYDSICLGNLTISVDKVKDEMVHLFSPLSKAVIYLGYHENITEKKLKKAVTWLTYDFVTKRKYYDNTIKYAEEIRKEQKRIIDRINEVVNK